MKIGRTDKNTHIISELREAWGTDRFSCRNGKDGLVITLYETNEDKKNATIGIVTDIEPIIVITDQETLEKEHYFRCIVGKK